MARSPGHRPLILLRWILLGLFLVAVAAVLRIYLGRDGQPAEPRLASDPESPVESADVVLAAEGFEYEVLEEGRTLFFIRSDRMVSDRRDRFVLEGVELRMEEDDGGLYTIASDRAVYDLDSRNATLEGAVVMSGPDGIELSGESFELQNSGRILESTSAPVAYRLPGAYAGTAEWVRINLHRDILRLRGNVVIDSAPGTEPPVRLTAGRMSYKQQEGLLRAEEGVVFTRGGDRLRSRRLSAYFEAAEDGVRAVTSIQGRWQVAGRIALDSSADRVGSLVFVAKRMGVTLDPTGTRVESVVLEGGDKRATLLLADGTGLRRTLRSRTIHTSFVDGAVSRLETFVPAVLEESLALAGAAPLRRLCGDALSAQLGPEGDLRDLVLDGAVEYRDSRLSAVGDRLEGDPEDKLQLGGTPARLLTGNNDVEAPKIVYSRGDGSLQATGGVRASGLDRSGVELASGDDRAPVLVTADRATWTEEPSEVVFRGQVRAWQGESFLLANRLRSLEDGARLVGEGAVKTVWKPRPDDPEARSPIDVDADEFVYMREQQRLDYSGRVRAHEAGRTLRCEELEILMDAERRIDSLRCEGDAVVDDPINGRTVRGSEALYTPGDRLVVISGAPVVLEQRDGTEMEGRRLRYDLDTGQVRILSEPRTSDPEKAPADPAEPAGG